jgi:LemA protein
MALYVVGCVVVIVLIYFLAAYNGLVRARNIVKDAWANIDTELKKRYDLVPNLVVAVQSYAGHEKSVLETVTQLRVQAMQAAGPTKGGLENQFSGALKSLFAVAENYPDLKASQNFSQLQDELTQVENDIQSARAYYNAAVREYNTAIAVVPKNIVAGAFHFAPADYFQADAQEKNPVAVKTGNSQP